MFGECEEITFEEVKAAITKAKSGKAPGPSGVVGEMLKAAGDVGIQWMTDLCNAVVYWRERFPRIGEKAGR